MLFMSFSSKPNSIEFSVFGGMHQINLRIIPRIIAPITVQQVSPIDQCWVHRRGDTQMKDATRNLASSTKTRKSFATNLGKKLDPLDS